MRTPLVQSRIEVTTAGRAAKAGLTQLRLDTDHWKSWVHERVRGWPNDAPGAWHLPDDVTDDYLAQIVAEARTRSASGRVKWVRRSRENHYLDLESMQAAAAHLLNIARIPEARRASAQQPTPEPPAPDAPAEPMAPERPKPGSAWTTGARHQAYDAAQRSNWVTGNRSGSKWHERW
jgi:hypothetical protein